MKLEVKGKRSGMKNSSALGRCARYAARLNPFGFFLISMSRLSSFIGSEASLDQ